MSRFSLTLVLLLFAGAVAPAAAPAQGQGLPQEDPQKKPVDPPKVTNKVNVKIEQHVDEPNILQHKRLYPPLRFEENGNLIVIDAETWYGMPQKDPEIPVNFGAAVRVSLLTLSIPAGSSGFPLSNPGAFGGAIGGNRPPPGNGDPVFPDPPISKPSNSAGLFGSGQGGESDSSAFSGPELTVPLKQDLSQWSSARWLPEATSLEVYGRAQTGHLTLFNTGTTAMLYGVGLRLNLPFLSGESSHVDASIAGGPAYLKTGIGKAMMFDGSVGLRAVQVLSPGINLVGSIEAQILKSSDTSAFGPAFNLGLDLSW